ncbi:hypothetical protein D3C81_1052630 [compost metagenome]
MVALNGAPTPVLLSLARRLKLKLPATVGVPDSTPVAVFRLRPAGRLPALTL